MVNFSGHPNSRFKTAEEHQAFVDKKRKARMDMIDALPEATRNLVHEYGFNVVNSFLIVGVKNPRQIKHIVETILDEFSPTRGSFSKQGLRTEVLNNDGIKNPEGKS